MHLTFSRHCFYPRVAKNQAMTSLTMTLSSMLFPYVFRIFFRNPRFIAVAICSNTISASKAIRLSETQVQIPWNKVSMVLEALLSRDSDFTFYRPSEKYHHRHLVDRRKHVVFVTVGLLRKQYLFFVFTSLSIDCSLVSARTTQPFLKKSSSTICSPKQSRL
jgi:hypothetical protein